MSGYAIGYLSPQPHIGGEPVRAFLLKRDNISFTKGISTVLIDKSMQLTTDMVFALIGVILLLLHFSLSKEIQIFILLAIFIPISLTIFFFDRMIRNKPFFSVIFRYSFLQRYRKDALEVEHIIHTFYVKHVKAFFKIIMINIILWLLMIVEYGAAMMLFGFSPDLISIFVVLAGVAISYSLPIPMALGVLELSQVSALSFLNLNTAVGLSISILVRIKDLIRSGIGVLSLLYYGVSWSIIKEISKNTK